MWAEAICSPCSLIAGADVVQQARAVAAVHLDDGEGVGGVVVDHDARRDGHGAQPRRLPPQLADLRLQPEAARQRLLDQHRQPRQAVRRVEGAARRVLHPEGVERHAVGHGVDARIDDGGARDGQRAGDAAEQARMVGAVDRDLGDRARLDHRGAERSAARPPAPPRGSCGVARMRLGSKDSQ
jgi:hypothetical protein